MSRTITIAVAGAGSTNVKATVAVNLSVAFAALGIAVELRDADPERHAARALVGDTAAAERVLVRPAGALRLDAVAVERGALETGAAVTVVDCAPRVDDRTVAQLVAASFVIVPVDGSPLSLRALDDVATAITALRAPARPAGAAALYVLLSRRLPRAVDRWSLVERLSDREDATLYAVTMPMGRGVRSVAGGARVAMQRRAATLYAPPTSAARAYATLAREILDVVRPKHGRVLGE